MIRVEHFAKTFFVGFARRRSEAARDISFSVEPKEIFGFLGPNGAGKTTTIKALLGLIRPDAGSLSLLGHPSDSMEWRAQVGYMPEHPNFYEFLTAFEMVVWFGRLSGLVRAEAEREAKRLLDRVGLAHAMNRRLRGYSKGMLQRAGLAQALVGSPKLLILDEPMTGLDPIGRREIRELILSLKDEGRTIFYSTHILPDVEMTCDRVSIIHKGKTMRTGPLQEILQATNRGVTVAFRKLPEATIVELHQSHPHAQAVADTIQLELPDVEAAQALTARLSAAGGELMRFEQHRDDLETIFVRSLGGDSRGGEA